MWNCNLIEGHMLKAIRPDIHHDKQTANVKVYQNTKLDTQRHITDKN